MSRGLSSGVCIFFGQMILGQGMDLGPDSVQLTSPLRLYPLFCMFHIFCLEVHPALLAQDLY